MTDLSEHGRRARRDAIWEAVFWNMGILGFFLLLTGVAATRRPEPRASTPCVLRELGQHNDLSAGDVLLALERCR